MRNINWKKSSIWDNVKFDCSPCEVTTGQISRDLKNKIRLRNWKIVSIFSNLNTMNNKNSCSEFGILVNICLCFVIFISTIVIYFINVGNLLYLSLLGIFLTICFMVLVEYNINIIKIIFFFFK